MRIPAPVRRSGFVALVLGLLFLSRAVTAASISELEIVTTTGDPAPLALVKANISSLEGTEFSSTALAEDIKRLYQTGFFDDVQSEVSEQPDGTYRLVVRLTPKPTIRTLSVQGNDEIKTKKLLDLVEVEEGAVLDERQVAAGVRAIIERYESKGYYGTGVRYDLAPVPESNQVDVVISVDESTRHKVRRVLFEGNTVFSDRELRKELVTKHSWFSHVFPTGYVRDAKLMEDRAILQGLYEDRGYLDFQIRELAQVPVRKGKWVEVVFQLDEGEPYTVSKLEVQGNTRFSAEELLAVVKLEEGEQHSAATETADVQAMRARYEELGYLDLFLRAERTTDPESRQVAITFRVDEGVPSTVRDIHIRGNEITKDEVIRRELAIQPGDLGDAGKVRVSRSRLENLNYFETVDITPMTTEHEDEKDLLITVTEKRTGQLMLGAGFSSEDSLVGMVEVSQGNFDWRDWPRFTGDGQRLRLRLNAGTERNEFSIDFTEPWWLDRRLRLDLELYRRERDQDEYSEEAYGGGAQVTRQLATYWRQSFGLRAKRVILDDFDAGLSPELLAEEGNYTANALTLGLSRDTRDRFLNPRKGSRLALNLELQPEAIGSYSNLYRVELRASKYFPVFSESVLKVSGQLAYVDAWSGDEPAIFDRYFAGGSSSVRGFERREVGPVDLNEDPVGGKSIMLAGVEFIFPVLDMVYASVFCDNGNVWRGAGDWDVGELNTSIGVGLQIELPIGPIRLDYGYPIITDQDHLDGANGEFHFNIGYWF